MKYLSAILFLLLTVNLCQAQTNEKNKIVITIDDLPFVGIGSYTDAECKTMFNKLISEIKKEKTPAIGFANESKLLINGELSNERVELLENWLNAGLNLGNHTYSHKGANMVPVDEYKEDIIKGESVLTRLLEKRGQKLKYFRHPYLHTGLSLEVKKEINDFLTSRDYTIAPVTLDNSEWIFAKAYSIACSKNDTEMISKIGTEYLTYMKQKLEYFESRSQALFGRNIAHILLIHANKLNSDYYGKLCEMLRSKNYEFITLETALKDNAYKTEDKFIRNAGISWIDRWALTMGKKREFFAGEPACPAGIMKYAGVESE